ncbi:MAG: hypothetical protein AB7O59_12685 [Pirellulales bacterium]
MSSGRDDAGHNSLAGFFFQLACAAGDAAVTLSSLRQECDGHRAVFAVEQYGQDASTSLGDVICLGQYKYSTDPDARPISRSELFEILDALKNSERRAIADGYTSVTYRLASNRDLDPSARGVVDAAKSGSPHPRLDNVHTRNSKKGKNKKPVTTRTTEHLSALRQIAKSLEIVTVDETIAFDKLRNHAATLGILEDELEAAVSRVNQMLFRKAASVERHFKVEELNSHLAGYQNPRPLGGDSARTFVVNQLKAYQWQSSEHDPVRRQLAEQIAATILDHALVVVTGEGGAGKTVCACTVLGDIVADEASSRVVIAVNARDVDDAWLSREIARIRNSPLQSEWIEPLARSLDRIDMSFRAPCRPQFVVLVDGIDEQCGFPTQPLERILRFFVEEERLVREGRPLRATLVVTCREFHQLARLLDRKGWGGEEEIGARIEVGVFDDSEFVELVTRSKLSGGVREQFLRRAAGGPASWGKSAIASVPREVVTVIAPSEMLYRAIRHPVVWRCFCALAEEKQLLAVQGAGNALLEIGAGLCEWFGNKVRIRNSGFHEVDTLYALKGIAMRFENCERDGDYTEDWLSPGEQASGWPTAWLGRLFEEGTSAGLLVEKVKRQVWCWRHSFVCEYLRTVSI